MPGCALAQAEAAVEAARRTAQPAKPIFAMGFLTGQEVDWLPHAPSILRDELPDIEIRVSSGFSTDLADDLQRGKLESRSCGASRSPISNTDVVTREPLVAILPQRSSAGRLPARSRRAN